MWPSVIGEGPKDPKSHNTQKHMTFPKKNPTDYMLLDMPMHIKQNLVGKKERKNKANKMIGRYERNWSNKY